MNEPLGLRVVSGRPDDAELAAVVAVLLAVAARPSPAPAAGGPRSLWGDPATMVRRPGDARPGGWAAPRL